MSATKNINAEKIQGNLSLPVISATTYQNLPAGVTVTGASYTNNTFTYTNNTGGTYSVSFNTVTGLTVNGVISATTYQNLPQYYAGIISGSTNWVNNNNGTITLPTTQVALFSNGNFEGPLNLYNVSGGIYSLNNNDTNYIVINYNNGSPIYAVLDNDGTINDSNIILYLIVYRDNNFIHVLEFGNYGSGLPNKLNDRVLMTDRFAHESGCSLGLSGSTGVVYITEGVVWNGVYRQSISAVTSNGDVYFQNFHSGGTWVYATTASTVNNTYYDNGTNRVSATPGKFLVNWYFRGQEVNDHIYEVFGTGEYDTIANAELSVEPSLPELITSHAFLVGRIIIGVNQSTGLTQSAFVTTFQSTQVTLHNDLLGIQGGSAGEYYHLSSSEYNNLPYLNNNNIFTSPQRFNGGLTANTISATTYVNLPTDINITGGTYSNNEIIFTNNTGGTFSVTGLTSGDYLYLSGGTVTGQTFFTSGLTITGDTIITDNTGNAVSIDSSTRELVDSNATPSINWNQRLLYDGSGINSTIDYGSALLYDTTSTPSIDWGNRQSYDDSGIVAIDWSLARRRLYDSSSAQSADWLVRTLTKSDGTTISFDWENGILTGQTNVETSTISATTYLNLPPSTDYYVTGGTYNYTGGTVTLNRNDGNNVSITGFNYNDTWTVELINALSVDVYAPYNLAISSTTNILGSPTITLYDDNVLYSLGSTIAIGSKITIVASVTGVTNLNIIRV